jgi:hypothetical protein
MWLIVPSTCSPCAAEQGDSTLASDWRSRLLARSAMSRSKHMPPKSWRAAWKKGGWMRRLFGRIYEPLTAARGVAQWISSLGGTLASLSPSQARVEAQMTLDTCGLTSPAFFVSSIGPAPSLKTCQGMCPSDCEKCDQNWKTWVTALKRRSSERRRSALRIDGNGYSSSLTPTKDDPGCAWPTPTVSESETRTNCGGGQGRVGRERLMLAGAVLYWPTPRATDGSKGGPNQVGSKGDLMLPSAAVQWSTPTVRDWKDGGCAEANVPTNGLPGRQAPRSMPGGENGMVLNPRFVETLMGWPIGWTNCVSVAVGSSHSKPLTPSTSCVNG